MEKQLLFHILELADSYALQTLHNYLNEEIKREKLPITIVVGGRSDFVGSSEIWKDVVAAPFPYDVDIIVKTHSDYETHRERGNAIDTAAPILSIDQAVLKNCVLPLSREEKMLLRKKYSISSEEPVVVIGFPERSAAVEKVVKELYKNAVLVLYGGSGCFCINGASSIYIPKETHDIYFQKLGLNPDAREKVMFFNGFGQLKYFYALADITLCGDNLVANSRPIHNFVEATEGGKFFLIPPTNTFQYGYTQLVQAGVIRECADLDHLIRAVKEEIRGFDENADINKKRAEHILETRETYLPVIKSHILNLLDKESPVLPSDMKVSRKGRDVTLIHPDTCWNLTAWETVKRNIFLRRKHHPQCR